MWVNHAVSVVASASGGPLGRGGTSCSTNNGTAYSYPSGGVTVDGTGVWTVSCTSTNNAYDVNGNVASSPTQSVSVHIDETPPAVAFEAGESFGPRGRRRGHERWAVRRLGRPGRDAPRERSHVAELADVVRRLAPDRAVRRLPRSRTGRG